MAKKVTIAELEKFTKSVAGENEVEVDIGGMVVTIKKLVNLANVIGMVSNVTATCFNVDTGDYTPDVLDFALRSEFIERYTNLTLPSDTEKRYYLLYASGIFETALEYVNQAQFDSIVRAVKERIVDVTETRNSNIERRASDIVARIESIADLVGKIVEGIDAESITNLIGAMTDGKIDEQKLVDAYFEHKEGGLEAESNREAFVKAE